MALPPRHLMTMTRRSNIFRLQGEKRAVHILSQVWRSLHCEFLFYSCQMLSNVVMVTSPHSARYVSICRAQSSRLEKTDAVDSLFDPLSHHGDGSQVPCLRDCDQRKYSLSKNVRVDYDVQIAASWRQTASCCNKMQ